MISSVAFLKYLQVFTTERTQRSVTATKFEIRNPKLETILKFQCSKLKTRRERYGAVIQDL
jgi:hypothetical protein